MNCSLMDRLVTESPLILGSASPRRKRILAGLGLEFTIDVPDVDESAADGETPVEHVRRLAWLKAATVAGRHEQGTVISADTIVVLDGDTARRLKVPIQARLVGYQVDSVDPALMGLGPVPAVNNLLKNRGCQSSG